MEAEIICMAMCEVDEDHNWSVTPGELLDYVARRRPWPVCCGKPVGILAHEVSHESS